MARQSLSKIKGLLSSQVTLNRWQWLILGALFLMPLLAVGNSAAGLNYHSVTSQDQISTNHELISQLSEQNRQLASEVKAQKNTIDKQKKDLSQLKNQNSVLSADLVATTSELAAEQSETKKKCYTDWQGNKVCKDIKKKKKYND